jgi:putative transposase
MPRQARIDAPGAIHHIICRGLDRKQIFMDDIDRNRFVARLSDVVQKTLTPCFAWSLIPNHFHLLLQTGTSPIATVMEKLLTGYAGEFNRRHNRHGHLFQNRYKSILCQTDRYLLELVRYIHLNPIRAGIVGSLEELKTYPYCGHSVLMGAALVSWQTTFEVFSRLAIDTAAARVKYEAFVAEAIAAGKRPDLVGGGLLRSAGGWEQIVLARRYGEHLKSDERILGDSEFVAGVLEGAQERMEKLCTYLQKGLDLDRLAQVVARLLGVNVSQVWEKGQKSQAVQARSLLCHWAIHELGMTATSLGKRLDLTQSGATRAAQRGEKIAIQNGWCLRKLIDE